MGASRVRGLLGLLLLHRGETVPSDVSPSSCGGVAARRGRRDAAHLGLGLRRIFRDAGSQAPILTRPGGYAVAIGDGEFDVSRFETTVDEARRHLAHQLYEEAANAYTAALSLWRGTVLQDSGLSGVEVPEIARLEESRLVAVEEGNEASLLCGRHERLLAPLAALCREHPFRERLWSQRMRALYGAGRQAEAFHAYAELRDLLAEELGIEPSQQLRELETAMLLQRPELERRHPIDFLPATATADNAVLITAPPESGSRLESYPTVAALARSEDAASYSFIDPADAVRAALALHLEDGVGRRSVIHHGPLDDPAGFATGVLTEAMAALAHLPEGALVATGETVDALAGDASGDHDRGVGDTSGAWQSSGCRPPRPRPPRPHEGRARDRCRRRAGTAAHANDVLHRTGSRTRADRRPAAPRSGDDPDRAGRRGQEQARGRSRGPRGRPLPRRRVVHRSGDRDPRSTTSRP